MSRIGKKPIVVPDNVQVIINGQDVSVKGPLGEQKITLLPGITVELVEKILNVHKASEEKAQNAYQGLFRSLLSNMVIGVSSGFEKNLEIVGVGYRATQQNENIQFQLGYSHEIIFKAPEGITLQVVDPTKVRVKGIDKQKVGQIAANIRELRPPEPYKGKGIRYKGEAVRKKAGKTGK